jgi:hypothetical protein
VAGRTTRGEARQATAVQGVPEGSAPVEIWALWAVPAVPAALAAPYTDSAVPAGQAELGVLVETVGRGVAVARVEMVETRSIRPIPRWERVERAARAVQAVRAVQEA